jgi:hypothetical protein
MNTATQLLIAILMTTPATDGVRDLCDVVHRLTGAPTICKPHKEGAPVYDANVCCAGGTCFATSGSCQDGEVLYYCGLGKPLPRKEVECYFEVPNYCDVHACMSSLTPPPQEIPICCSQGLCWESTSAKDCELNDIYWCSSGVSNPDGTITCLDEG